MILVWNLYDLGIGHVGMILVWNLLVSTWYGTCWYDPSMESVVWAWYGTCWYDPGMEPVGMILVWNL